MTLKSMLLLEPISVDIGMNKGKSSPLPKKKTISQIDLMTYMAGLIYVKTRFLPTKIHSVPLGLAQISSILKEKGVHASHEPFILDALYRSLTDREIEQRIRSHDYDHVLLSVGSQVAADETIRYARIVKRINNDTPIIVGGVYPTFYPEWFMEHLEVDMVIRGPAEDAMRQYVSQHNTSSKNIPGLCYRNGNNIHISPEYALVPDQETLPPMDLEGMNIDAYMKDNPFANLSTSRGCPFGCPFCLHAAYWSCKVQFRKIENVQLEMKTFQDHGCKAGYIVDAIFTLNMKHVQKFVDAYAREKISIKLAFETRADSFNKATADLCSHFHPPLVWFGGESGSPRILSNLPGKQADGGKKHLDDMRAAVQNARQAGIMSGSSWVVGLPGETMETVKETESFILELLRSGMDLADVRYLQVFPGTEYYNHAKDWGIQLENGGIQPGKGDWRETISHRTFAMTADEIKRSAIDLQQTILQYQKNTPVYPRVIRTLKLAEFMSRHKMLARALIKMANKA